MDIWSGLTIDEIKLIKEHYDKDELNLYHNPDVKLIHISNIIKDNSKVITAYTLQSKGLLAVSLSQPTLWDGNSGFVNSIDSVKTPLFHDMFKNLNLDFEDIL
jgi:hypothetical protein